MFSLAMLAVVLFLGIALTCSLRDASNRVYFSNFEKGGMAAAITAGAARATALLLAGLFYLCIAAAVCGLIYSVVLLGAHALSMFGA